MATNRSTTKILFHRGRFKVSAGRWPGMPIPYSSQNYGWGKTGGMGRFGGGWDWCLGIEVSSSSCVFNLLYGFITISWYKKQD